MEINNLKMKTLLLAFLMILSVQTIAQDIDYTSQDTVKTSISSLQELGGENYVIRDTIITGKQDTFIYVSPQQDSLPTYQQLLIDSIYTARRINYLNGLINKITVEESALRNRQTQISTNLTTVRSN